MQKEKKTYLQIWEKERRKQILCGKECNIIDLQLYKLCKQCKKQQQQSEQATANWVTNFRGSVETTNYKTSMHIKSNITVNSNIDEYKIKYQWM